MQCKTGGNLLCSNKNPFAWSGILGEYDRGSVDGSEKMVQVDTLIVHSGFDHVSDLPHEAQTVVIDISTHLIYFYF
jgi:hypothetical protein